MSKRPVSSSLACVLAIVLCVLLAGFTLFVIPRFIAIFEDFDTELPTVTLIIIHSRNLLAAGLMLLAIFLIIKEVRLNTKKQIALMINLVALLMHMLILVIFGLGLFLPFFKVMQALE